MTRDPAFQVSFGQAASDYDYPRVYSHDGDGELYDSFFLEDPSFSAPAYNDNFGTDDQLLNPLASERPYAFSQTVSPIDEPTQFNYTTSAAPSVCDGPSSLPRASWLSASPSVHTTGTSPLDGRLYQGLFDACGGTQSPLGDPIASPLLDTQSSGSFESSFHTASASFYNPFVSASPGALSPFDTPSSQAVSNVGTWADPTIEPIPELDHGDAVPIPIPPVNAQSFNDSFAPQPWFAEPSQHPTRPRAITIPQSPRPLRTQTPRRSALQVPLSPISPDARRLSRSAVLPRSLSNRDPKRSRQKVATPSPNTQQFGWVSYQPHHQTNKLVPSGTDGNRGKRQKGRVGALTAEQRSHAALMRHIGSCSNCKRRKERCDPGTPCKSCLEHYKGDLINHPCRDRLLVNFCDKFLAERLGWHPTYRPVKLFINGGSFATATEFTHNIPLIFGFGPPLQVSVHAVALHSGETMMHDHFEYSWPPGSSADRMHTRAVLPAVLSNESRFSLPGMLDDHLSLLVRHHFRSFPLFCSPLRILREVYVFSRSLASNPSHSRVLHQALKLLVLVHIGGDITLPSPSTNPTLAQLVRNTMFVGEDVTPTPCFIRSQIGAVLPGLAMKLMREVLSSLEQLFLNRECDEWPIALATLLIVLMTVESIQYHAAKLPYHDLNDAPVSRTKLDDDSKVDDDGVKALLAFYSACFPGCHARLRPEWEGEATPSVRSDGLGMSEMTPEDKFVASVRDAVRRASPQGYLEEKASDDERVGDDMGFFFDRLVARLLVMKI